jgi:hypothetical protein
VKVKAKIMFNKKLKLITGVELSQRIIYFQKGNIESQSTALLYHTLAKAKYVNNTKKSCTYDGASIWDSLPERDSIPELKNLVKNVQFRYATTGTFFLPSPPPSPTFPGNIFYGCPFRYPKVPLEAGAPPPIF